MFFDEDGFTCRYAMVFVYVLLSSFIASFTTLSIKSLAEIIDRIYLGDNLLFSRYFNLFLSTLVLCSVLQIYWANRALKHYDALLVIPIFHVSWTILSIFTAGFYFQEFTHYTPRQMRRFFLGIVVILAGSLFLAARVTNRSHVASRRIETRESTMRRED